MENLGANSCLFTHPAVMESHYHSFGVVFVNVVQYLSGFSSVFGLYQYLALLLLNAPLCSKANCVCLPFGTEQVVYSELLKLFHRCFFIIMAENVRGACRSLIGRSDNR